MNVENLALETYSFIAAPQDARCKWWCVILPENHINPAARIESPFLRKNDDLELCEGDMLIESEEMHHRKQRGYRVRILIICRNAEEKNKLWCFKLKPSIAKKQFIKTSDPILAASGSGDVAGAVRIGIWLRKQSDLYAAIKQLMAVEENS